MSQSFFLIYKPQWRESEISVFVNEHAIAEFAVLAETVNRLNEDPLFNLVIFSFFFSDNVLSVKI